MNQYITFETVNDEWNKPRSRRLLNPGICLECGVDVLKTKAVQEAFEVRYGTSDYESLTADGRAAVKVELAHHDEIFHAREKQRIINEDELPVACHNGINITKAQRTVEDDRKLKREAEKKAAIAAQLGIIAQQNQPQVIYVQAPPAPTSRSRSTKKKTTVLKPTVIPAESTEE